MFFEKINGIWDTGTPPSRASLMNTKSGIFTRGFATRENTAFGVHSVK